MKTIFKVGGLAAATMLLPACATITRGTEQKFAIESTPPDAQVELSTGEKCVTPCRLKLKRKKEFVATFTKPGYHQLKAEVKSKFSGGGAAAGAGNVLIGGVVGAIVDGTNGSLNDLKPNPLSVTLAPLEAVAAAEPAVEGAMAPPAAAAETAPAIAAAPADATAAAPAAQPSRSEGLE